MEKKNTITIQKGQPQRGAPTWFTLVELIVVMAIIAILSTTAFFSYSSYTVGARDTARQADMGSMKVVLRSTKQKNGAYPFPTGSVTEIVRGSLSGLVVAKQWLFLPNIGLEWSTQAYTDPKTKGSYLYSSTKSGQECQIGMTLETEGIDPVSFTDGDFRSVTPLVPVLLVATGAASVDIDIAGSELLFIGNGSLKNLPYDMDGNIRNDATTLAEALGSTSANDSSSAYADCQSIFDGGRSIGSGTYYIRTETGSLTSTGCAMAY